MAYDTTAIYVYFSPEDVQSIISGKLGLKYSGPSVCNQYTFCIGTGRNQKNIVEVLRFSKLAVFFCFVSCFLEDQCDQI